MHFVFLVGSISMSTPTMSTSAPAVRVVVWFRRDKNLVNGVDDTVGSLNVRIDDLGAVNIDLLVVFDIDVKGGTLQAH